jgi:cobalamin biosynthetic protein CobC
MRAALGPWAVSGPALWIGQQALSDGAWLAEAKSRCHADAARLDEVLREAGMTPLGGTTLFRLVRTGEAARIARQLGEAGILVRSFANQPDWLRFGLPGSEDVWRRLRAALQHAG